jgi:hypothetical protein
MKRNAAGAIPKPIPDKSVANRMSFVAGFSLRLSLKE